MADKVFVWIDLETTGLNPQTHRILEVYAECSVRNDPMVIDPERRPFHQVCSFKPSTLTNLDIAVNEMHTANGLFRDCLESTYHAGFLDNDLVRWLKPDPNIQYTIAGRSVHFDADFLKIDCPNFFEKLHYRRYDVSCIEMFCRQLGMPPLLKEKAHRAGEDVAEAIAHLQQCREWLGASGEPA